MIAAVVRKGYAGLSNAEPNWRNVLAHAIIQKEGNYDSF